MVGRLSKAEAEEASRAGSTMMWRARVPLKGSSGGGMARFAFREDLWLWRVEPNEGSSFGA